MSLRSTVKRRGVVPRGALRALTFGCEDAAAEAGAAAEADAAGARGDVVLLSVVAPGTIMIASLALRDMFAPVSPAEELARRAVECNSCGQANVRKSEFR